ncbi:MAG: hypothetical protein WCR72_19700, partial [Bacteroidota bacterium]
LIGYVYSIKVNPVLQHPVLIFSFPCFILLFFSYAGCDFDRAKRWLLALFLAAGVLGTTTVNRYYNKQHFGEFKDIARLTALWQQQYGDTAITKVISVNSPYYIEYYLARNEAKVKFDLYDIRESEGLKALSETLKSSRKPYFLYALTKPAPAEGEDIIRSYFPFILERKDYDGLSSVTLFAREKGQSWQQANQLKEIRSLKAGPTEDSLVTAENGEAVKAFKMDVSAEYSPGIELNANELIGKKNLVIEAETDLFSSEGAAGATLVISLETAEGKSLQWEGSSASYIETPGKWCHLINTMKMDTNIPGNAKLKVYFWNKDKKLVYLRGLKCRILN